MGSHFWHPNLVSFLVPQNGVKTDPKAPKLGGYSDPNVGYVFDSQKVDLRTLKWMPQETIADREKWISCFQKTMNSGCRGGETISSSGLERVPNPVSKTQLPCTGSSLLGKNNG